MKWYQSTKNLSCFARTFKTGALLFIIGLIGPGLTSCELLGIPLTTWELRGNVTLDAPTIDLTGKKVKMAAFYFAGGDGRLTSAKTMVSNYVVVDNTLPAFTLTVDTTSLNPKDGDRIFLYMWIEADAGANNAYDNIEQKCIVINKSPDPVFAADSYASFIYYADRDGLENGWYYNSPGGVREVDKLTGAVLTNEVYF